MKELDSMKALKLKLKSKSSKDNQMGFIAKPTITLNNEGCRFHDKPMELLSVNEVRKSLRMPIGVLIRLAEHCSIRLEIQCDRRVKA